MRFRQFLVAALTVVASCDFLSPKDPDYRQIAIDETNRREALWKALAIHNYDFDFQRQCSCSITATQPVRISVRADVITHVRDILGGEVTPQADIPWPTIDSLFLWSRLLLADRGFAVEMEFDEQFNHPKHIRGEHPVVPSVEHNSGNIVVRAAGDPIIVGSAAGYLMGAPLSKSKSVTWRSRKYADQ